MKTLKQFLKGAIAVIMSAAMLLGIVACGNENGGDDLPPAGVTISIAQPAEIEIEEGDEITLTVSVDNAEDKTYTWTVSDPSILKVENDIVSIVRVPNVDRRVTVTATANADTTKTASVTFTVKTPVVEGSVGELTTAKLLALGDSSITVEGTLTDYYFDINNSYNNTERAYDMKVLMEDGAWSGSYRYAQNGAEAAGDWITDVYRRGDDGAADSYGNSGHYVKQMYIDKNNQATGAIVKDYMSVPAVWEAQHLYNHLGDLATNVQSKFKYDIDTEQYRYQPAPAPTAEQMSDEAIVGAYTDDQYLLTYLAYSLTPLLEDTLASLYITIEDGEIASLVAQTETEYDSEYAEEVTAYAYTVIELTFSGIGTTEVEDPEPYEEDSYTPYLAEAIEKMQSAKNYTYRLVDTTVSAPSASDYDYSLESAVLTGQSVSVAPSIGEARQTAVASPLRYVNNTSASGTVGTIGFVTETDILIARTIQYTATMDGLDYRTEYTGYRQFTDENGEPYYEEFAYNASLENTAVEGGLGAFYGTRHIEGNMFDAMPSFDFSAAVFECISANNTGTYTFKLRSTAITRDIAMEVSAYSYASSASASSTTAFTITVDANGNLKSTTYPYSIVSGTYLGYCTTTYEAVGTTSIPEDQFAGYIHREVKTSWSQYEAKQYHINHSTVSPYDEADMETAFKATFGEARFNNLPSPTALLDVFGDYLSGPFHNWKDVVDADGNTTYMDYWNINTQSREYDENSKITNYDELIADLTASLQKEGYSQDFANSGTSGGSKYVSYTKGGADDGVQIVVENMGTKWFYLSIYPLGGWKLNK